MEKRRVRLEINGIVCGLITEESDEYMDALCVEVGDMMRKILAASPFITREAAALTTALNFCDESRRGDTQVADMKQRNREMERRVLEAERQTVALKKENNQLWEETGALLTETDTVDQTELEELKREIAQLKAENAALKMKAMPLDESRDEEIKLRNPLRYYEGDQEGFVSFFEKKSDE